jgi:hypothetical protein
MPEAGFGDGLLLYQAAAVAQDSLQGALYPGHLAHYNLYVLPDFVAWLSAGGVRGLGGDQPCAARGHAARASGVAGVGACAAGACLPRSLRLLDARGRQPAVDS